MQTAKFVRGSGGQTEFVLRVKQAGNPNFRFLDPKDRLHLYFRWLVETNPQVSTLCMQLHCNISLGASCAPKSSNLESIFVCPISQTAVGRQLDVYLQAGCLPSVCPAQQAVASRCAWQLDRLLVSLKCLCQPSCCTTKVLALLICRTL